jgi:hypothetical protein
MALDRILERRDDGRVRAVGLDNKVEGMDRLRSISVDSRILTSVLGH